MLNFSAEHCNPGRFHRRRQPRGDEVTVLAGGTSAEQVIEGISIGVGAAIKPGLGLLVALAIVIDNLTEALSIGELIRDRQDDKPGRPPVWRIVKWTTLIGPLLFSSAFWMVFPARVIIVRSGLSLCRRRRRHALSHGNGSSPGGGGTIAVSSAGARNRFMTTFALGQFFQAKRRTLPNRIRPPMVLVKR
jgi:hypothetical protein